MNTVRKTAALALFTLALVMAPGAGRSVAQQGYDWEKGEREIRRLPPTAFEELPAAVVEELEDRGCSVPQSDFMDEPHNVVQGEFAHGGRIDWAVLCSRQGKSSILIFWGSPTGCPDELAQAEDKSFLQGWTAGQLVYSRFIGASDPERMRRLQEEFGDDEPLPPLEHDGIEDAFAGKGSVIHCCDGNQWSTLTGMD